MLFSSLCCSIFSSVQKNSKQKLVRFFTLLIQHCLSVGQSLSCRKKRIPPDEMTSTRMFLGNPQGRNNLSSCINILQQSKIKKTRSRSISHALQKPQIEKKALYIKVHVSSCSFGVLYTTAPKEQDLEVEKQPKNLKKALGIRPCFLSPKIPSIQHCP